MATRRATWRSPAWARGSPAASGAGRRRAGRRGRAAAPVPAGASRRTLAAATPAQRRTPRSAAQALGHAVGLDDVAQHEQRGGSFPGAAQLAGCIGVPSKLIAATRPRRQPELPQQGPDRRGEDNVASSRPSRTPGRVRRHLQRQDGGVHDHAHERPVQVADRRFGGQRCQLGTITVTKARALNGHDGLRDDVPITSQGVVNQLQLVIVYFIRASTARSRSSATGSPSRPRCSRSLPRSPGPASEARPRPAPPTNPNSPLRTTGEPYPTTA